MHLYDFQLLFLIIHTKQRLFPYKLRQLQMNFFNQVPHPWTIRTTKKNKKLESVRVQININ